MINKDKIISSIKNGKTYLGIEFGSTRIKGVLIDETLMPIASGSHHWENKHENGVWTYSMEDVWAGIRACYSALVQDVKDKYNTELNNIGSIGVSAMMHGYLPFDEKGNQLVSFRTWRNTSTAQAAEKLTNEFNFNIPQRWSIAHLYQAILNNEEHTSKISFITTLAGYVHWQLTGKKVLGIGDASGMFPIDSQVNNFDKVLLDKFDNLVQDKNYSWKISDILPQVLLAGEEAGKLSEQGAKLIDPSGKLQAGIPLCPPEGDAGTGMVATNSVSMCTGNVSAGTSIFAMIVLQKKLNKLYRQIDMVTTPTGAPVAMVHCNNCSSDIDSWVNLFAEFIKLSGRQIDYDQLYTSLFNVALQGDNDCGGLLAFNYLSGEHNTGMSEGRPLFMRTAESNMNLANFMRSHLYSAVSTLRIGMDVLLEEEKVKINKLYGHGGFFKTEGIGQKVLADALDTPVSVMATAGEGGAWGIALLASYIKENNENKELGEYLENKVFAMAKVTEVLPDAAGSKGFNEYLKHYKACLPVEKSATECFNI